MKLYWGPHTCAIGIHLLLEEVGAAYETQKLDVAGGETRRAPFLAINPKGKVPTLVRDDGSVLTEFSAIATWIARTWPEAGLLPSDPDAEARATEIVAFVEGTLHGQGYARMFSPQTFEPPGMPRQTIGLGRDAVVRRGREMVEAGFAILDAQLGGDGYAVGETLTVADAALFYVERWAPQNGVTLPARVERHFLAMLERPAVRTVREFWGEL